jgi:hypothetical protein
MVMNFWVLFLTVNFLTNYATISFSRNTMLDGVFTVPGNKFACMLQALYYTYQYIISLVARQQI